MNEDETQITYQKHVIPKYLLTTKFQSLPCKYVDVCQGYIDRVLVFSTCFIQITIISTTDVFVDIHPYSTCVWKPSNFINN